MTKDPSEAAGVIGLLLRRFTLRHWRRHWRSTLLLVGILALGVSVFLSIRLANRAAVSGFGMFTESIAGESDFVLRPVAGDTMPESRLREVREILNPLPVAIFPVVEATVAEFSESRETAPPKQVIGADLVALRNAVTLGAGDAPAGGGDPDGEDAGFFLGSAEHGFVAASWAASNKRSIGDRIELVVNDRVVSLTIEGLLEDDPLRPSVPENLILMDLPGAQAFLGCTGKISRIELVVPEGAMSSEVRSEIERKLEPLEGKQWQFQNAKERKSSVAKMTYAFRMNLTVLSTLALLVGTYLILQALEAAVVRRRGEIAVLSSLGVEPRTIKRLWLSESLVLGVIGSALGIGLGWAVAQLTVGAIARTVNGLYYTTTTEAASLHPGEAAVAFGFGVIASVLAGWLPARDAASTPPAQALRSGNRSEGLSVLKRPGLGLLAGGMALGFGFLPPLNSEGGNHIPLGGYLAAFFWLVSLSILAGCCFRPVGQLLKPLFAGRVEAGYASSQFRRPQGRHRLAVAGLVAAIGMASGMGILVHSFEGTLTGWIGQLLKADLYVATAGATNASNANTMTPATWQAILHDESVEGADVIRRYPLEFEGRRIRLAGSEYNPESGRRLDLTMLDAPDDPDPRSLAMIRENGVVPCWINEFMSRRFDISRGDRVEIETPLGPRMVLVEAVYADYSDDAGTILVNRAFTSRWFDDDTVSNMAIYLEQGTDFDRIQARWKEAYPALVVRQNAWLRKEALRVFHQTFAVTYALEAIGVVVAVAGLGLALASLMVERRDELATLKSIGFTRPQIARASAIEGAALGGIGFAGGFSLSLILGALLIFVINRQSFGWTLEYRVPWALLLGLGFLTLLTSAVVSSLVGYHGAKLLSDREE